MASGVLPFGFKPSLSSAHALMSQFTSSVMESTYSTSSFVGLVSSMRRLQMPPNSRAMPKFRQMLLAWPMCREPFGSGGKRVWMRGYLCSLTCAATMSRIKSDGAAGAGVFSFGMLMLFERRLNNLPRFSKPRLNPCDRIKTRFAPEGVVSIARHIHENRIGMGTQLQFNGRQIIAAPGASLFD